MDKPDTFILKTQRLEWHRFSDEDIDFIITLVNTPLWLQNIGDRNVHSEDDALNYLRNGPYKNYADYGYGLGKVVLADSSTIIGNCGILKRSTHEEPEIGYAFLPEYFGKGYAQEIVSAILEYASLSIGLKKIYAKVIPSNIPSIKLLEKLGFSLVEEKIVNNERLCIYQKLL